MSEKNSFLRGAFILAIAAMLSKLLGSVYTIFLQNVIGDSGMGLYNMAYPIYQALLSLSTAGLPVAVSKFVAEYNAIGDYRGAKKVFRVSLAVLTLTGLICFVFLVVNAPFYARLAGDPAAEPAILAIAPALLIVPFMSAIKGYFQGWQTMEPTAVSQLVDQFVRVVTIIVAAFLLLRWGYSVKIAAAGAAFGAVTGAIAGMVALLWFIWQRRGLFKYGLERAPETEMEPTWKIVKKLAYYALPISLGALLVPLMNNVDVLTVVNLLKDGGMAQHKATELFGLLSGRAFKLMLLPSTFATAIGAALMPAVSAAAAVKDQGLIAKRVDLAMRLTFIISMPAAVGIAILAGPIDITLFKTSAGSEAIAILSAATLLSSVQVTTATILVGLGKVYLPVAHLIIGGVIKLVFNLLLVPQFGINGAAASTDISYLVAALLNLWAVQRAVGHNLQFQSFFFKPLLASFFMGVFVYATRSQISLMVFHSLHSVRLENTVVTLIAVVIGCIIFAIALPVTGSITRSDVESMPRFGPMMVRLCSRIGILR